MFPVIVSVPWNVGFNAFSPVLGTSHQFGNKKKKKIAFTILLNCDLRMFLGGWHCKIHISIYH